MKTSELTGALLDYWVARAEGVSAEDLAEQHRRHQACRNGLVEATPLSVRDLKIDYSTNWALTGPLLEKHTLELEVLTDPVRWCARAWDGRVMRDSYGDTPRIAICRAVVHAAFGDEVEDLPC